MAREKVFKFTNNKGETIEVEFISCEYDAKNPHSLPRLWKKSGYVSEIFSRYIWAETYVTGKDGFCWSRYNPQQKTNEAGRTVINFDYVMEDTAENRRELLAEIVRRAMA